MSTPYDDERKLYTTPIKLDINTKAPSKWRFVDLETGDIWRAKIDPLAHLCTGFIRAEDICVTKKHEAKIRLLERLHKLLSSLSDQGHVCASSINSRGDYYRDLTTLCHTDLAYGRGVIHDSSRSYCDFPDLYTAQTALKTAGFVKDSGANNMWVCQ